MTADSVVVVGPGALGCLFAALLREGGEGVALLDRDPERAGRLAAAGLRLSGPGDAPERTVSVRATADPAAAGPAGLLLLCVKSGDTEAAVTRAAAVAGAAPLLVLQNGLGRAEAVAEALAAAGGDPARVLGGVTAEGATLLAEGRVRCAGRGATRVGALRPGGAGAARAAVARLAAGGLDARFEPDLRQVVWEKLQVNAAINALTGLLGCPNGDLLRSEAARSLAAEAALEVAAVARACAIPGDWGEGSARRRWEAVAAATAANISSTLQDLRRFRRSEVHDINGAVERLGREVGIPVPLNGLLTRLVAATEQLGGEAMGRSTGSKRG